MFTPTLPANVIKIQNQVVIRIVRVLGGISVLLLLSGKLHVFGSGLLIHVCLYISFLFTILFFIYHLFISYHRLKHICKLLKSDKLDIRNSPLDKFATYAAKLVLCAKGTCEVAAPVGVVIGVLQGFDQIRAAKGLDPIFIPFLADIVMPDNEETKIYKENRRSTAELGQNRMSRSFNRYCLN